MPERLGARAARAAEMSLKKIACGVAVLALGACASLPNSPNVLVLPGSTKTFDQFRADDLDCRGYAYNAIGGKAAEQSVNSATGTGAAVGAAIGTVTGAALGGSSGAAVGAGFGLATGAAVGSSQSASVGYSTQTRYDNAFTQCMYAKGHKVPVAGRYSDSPRSTQAARTPPPPPPPGQPPAEAPPDYRPR
jgi:hypothetical protein